MRTTPSAERQLASTVDNNAPPNINDDGRASDTTSQGSLMPAVEYITTFSEEGCSGVNCCQSPLDQTQPCVPEEGSRAVEQPRRSSAQVLRTDMESSPCDP